MCVAALATFTYKIILFQLFLPAGLLQAFCSVCWDSEFEESDLVVLDGNIVRSGCGCGYCGGDGCG